MIEQYAKVKRRTELHSLESSYVDEWALLRRQRKLAQTEIVKNLKLNINKYAAEIEEDNKQITILETFLNEADTKAPEQIESERSALEHKLASIANNNVSGKCFDKSYNFFGYYIYDYFHSIKRT